MKNVKIVVFVPLSHCDIVRKAVGKVGGGVIGEYSFCSFSSIGVGRFLPGDKTNPHIGEIGSLETVKEERIEIVCPREIAKKIIRTIRKVHPYEEVAFDIYPLLEEGEL